MAKLNVAMIGVGRRGASTRLPHILVMNDRFNLVAICDRDEARASELAAKHGVRAYGRVQDLVERERLDAAAVSTPGDSHHALCVYLAEHGVNILVETPVAITLPLADLIVDAVERNKVKLEVAEQYPRDPMHFFKRQVIQEGLIGDVLRIYSLFQTGGYHIFSSLRFLAGADATRVTGIVMDRSIPRVNVSEIRQYAAEKWEMGIVDFANGAMGLMAYSELYHGRALGRKSRTLFQVDGTTGSIVEDEVHLTTEAQRLSGGRATVYPIRTVTREVDGVRLLERMEIETEPRVVWENPFPQYRVGAGGLALLEEMDSLAQAVIHDRPTRWDARAGRKDLELEIATNESGRRGREPLALPLSAVTAYEERLHEQFRTRYGRDPFDVEGLVDTFFPKV